MKPLYLLSLNSYLCPKRIFRVDSAEFTRFDHKNMCVVNREFFTNFLGDVMKWKNFCNSYVKCYCGRGDDINLTL